MGTILGRGYTLDSSPWILSPSLWEALRLEGMLWQRVKRRHTVEIHKFNNKGECVQEGLQIQNICLRIYDT